MRDDSTSPGWSRRQRILAPAGVFVILLASFAFWWHARDWNSASRLMLTYAIVDRGTIVLDGFEAQTRDIARFEGHFYTDKQPGYSLLAIVPYAATKTLLGVPNHPIDGPALRHWPADYGTTLGTSGLATAIAGAVLVVLAGRVGCGPRAAVLVALAYGLATPAYAYATMSYGHQVTAACLLGSMAILDRPGDRRPSLGMAAAGFLAALASVVELSVGPVSAILGVFAMAKVIGRAAPPMALGAFVAGALVPSAVLAFYNIMAFGAPWDMGYFHHWNPLFDRVHSEDNPLGLTGPDWSKAIPLLWGEYRGLFFYAPILLLSVPGWGALIVRRRFGIAVVSISTCAAIFLVNLSYPEWTGGWSTGPRLLVPLLPFAMLPVAGLLAVGGRGAFFVAGVLSILGGALMLLFQGIGAHVPQDVVDPLRTLVWPLWSGQPVPEWWIGGRFGRNLVSVAVPERIARWPARWQWVQFLPLIVSQIALIATLMAALGRGHGPRRSTTPGS